MSSSDITLYIDEGGDSGANDGIGFYSGRHEWFTLSGVAVRNDREQEIIGWIDGLRGIARAHQGPTLHYHRIAKQRRTSVCENVAQLPLRGFVIASHKSNLREYQNARLGGVKPAVLYNFCCRLLLERVMLWYSRWLEAEQAPARPIRIIFSRLGGHDYPALFGYLERCSMQKREKRSTLPFKEWIPEMLRRDMLLVQPAKQSAGCQIADVVASAFYQAANSASPNHSIEPALALRRIMARGSDRTSLDLGVTVWPLSHQGRLPVAARGIFEAYGYKFE